MPQYMLLIYNPAGSPMTPEQMREIGPRFDTYTQELQDAGVLVGGDALEGPDVATTVRERDGQTQFTDGPFAETKEFLAGYYLVDCPDLDTALRTLRTCRTSGTGPAGVPPGGGRGGRRTGRLTPAALTRAGVVVTPRWRRACETPRVGGLGRPAVGIADRIGE